MEKIIWLTVLLFFARSEPIYTDYQFISSQTKILGVQWNDGELILDVSEDIASYGGGNAMEYEVVSNVLDQVFSDPKVDVFTLLIEGEEKELPEGTQLLKYTREQYMENYKDDNDDLK